MKLSRMFSTSKYKGTVNYIDSQKRYELLRTILYFLISVSLFAAGYLTTKTKVNLLTIVAVLGCLPASKSLVNTIMFFRFHSCPREDVIKIVPICRGLVNLFDMIFTTYEKNYQIYHLAIRGNTLVCYTAQKNFQETAFKQHICDTLAMEHVKGITVKVFYDLKKYTDRLEQLNQLEEDESLTHSVESILLSIAL